MIELNVKVGDIKTDIKDLKDGFASRVSDLEVRTKKIENKILGYEGKGKGINSSWTFVVGAIAMVSAIIALVLNAIRLFRLGL